MKINCGSYHKVNYKEICCFTNLIEMNEYAENQLKVESYSKILYKIIEKVHEKDDVLFEKFPLNIMKSLIEILSKYINFFYFSG